MAFELNVPLRPLHNKEERAVFFNELQTAKSTTSSSTKQISLGLIENIELLLREPLPDVATSSAKRQRINETVLVSQATCAFFNSYPYSAASDHAEVAPSELRK